MPSLFQLKQKYESGEKLAVLTCYDASFARAQEQAGVDMILVGDSLGMVIQGHSSTLPVQLTDMSYHTAAVARGAPNTWIMADLPFGGYQISPQVAFEHAVPLLQAGAHMVKLEGGAVMVESVRFLTERGVPVCAHLGLTPQSVHQLGGYRVQGRGEAQAEQLLTDALALQEAGASMVLLELIPAPLAARVTAALAIPTIGIGAGPDCSGQVLVLHDMLGLHAGKTPRFVKDYLEAHGTIAAAFKSYIQEVKAGSYPAPEHCFHE